MYWCPAFFSQSPPLRASIMIHEGVHKFVKYGDGDTPRDLGYELSPEFEKVLDEAQSSTGQHETQHRYSLAEFDLDEADIRRELAPLFERFAWPSVEAPRDESTT